MNQSTAIARPSDHRSAAELSSDADSVPAKPSKAARIAWPCGNTEVVAKDAPKRAFLLRMVHEAAAGGKQLTVAQQAAAVALGLWSPSAEDAPIVQTPPLPAPSPTAKRVHWRPAGDVQSTQSFAADPADSLKTSRQTQIQANKAEARSPSLSLPPVPQGHDARFARAKEICALHGLAPSSQDKVLIIFSPHDSGLPSLIRDGIGLDVATIDWKDDPVNQDCTNAHVMTKVLSALKGGEYSFVVLENECASYSIGKDGHQRPLSCPEGRKDLNMRQKANLAWHDRMAMFSAAVIRVCHELNIDFILETPALRHDPSSPAYWPAYAEHASLLDLQCMKDCIEDLGLVVIIIAQCKLGGRYQKYTALLIPGRLKKLAEEIFAHARKCTCASHEEVAYGVDSDGIPHATKAASYPPGMNMALLELIRRALASKPIFFSEYLHVGSDRPHAPDGDQVQHEDWAPSGSLRQLEPEVVELLLREPLPRHNVPNITSPVDPPRELHHYPGPFTTTQLIPVKTWQAVATFQKDHEKCVDRASRGPEGWKAARQLRPEAIAFTEDECLNPPAQGHSYTQREDELWHAVRPSTAARPPDMKLKYDEFKRLADKWDLKDNRTLSYIQHGYPSSPLLPRATVLHGTHVGGLKNMAALEACMAKDVEAGYYSVHGKMPKRWPLIVQPMNIVVQHGNPRATIDCSIIVDHRIGSFNSKLDIDTMLQGYRVKLLRVWQYCRGCAILEQMCRQSLSSKFKIFKADFRAFFRRHGLQELEKFKNGRLLREFSCDDNLNFGGRIAPDLTGNESNAVCYFARHETRYLDGEYPTHDDVLARFLEYRRSLAASYGEPTDPEFVWYVLFLLYFYADDGLGGATNDKLYRQDGSPLFVLVTDNDGVQTKVHQERCDMYIEMIIIMCAKLGHETPANKLVYPCRRLVGLGTDVDLDRLSRCLDDEKRLRYLADLRLVRQGRGRLDNGLVVTDYDLFNKLVHKLLHASDSRPLGRQYLFYCRKAARTPNRLSPPAVIITKEADKELDWWEEELTIEDHTGLPLASRRHFPAVSSPSTLVIYSDSSREDVDSMAIEELEGEIIASAEDLFEPGELDDADEDESSGLGAWAVIHHIFFYIHDVWAPWELKAFSINVTELATEVIAMLTLADLHSSVTHVLSMVDNTSAEFVSERGRPGKDSLGMHHINKERQQHITSRGLHQKTSRVTSKDNDIADLLSRGRIKAALRIAREAGLVTIRVPIPPEYRDLSAIPKTWA